MSLPLHRTTTIIQSELQIAHAITASSLDQSVIPKLIRPTYYNSIILIGHTISQLRAGYSAILPIKAHAGALADTPVPHKSPYA